MKPTASRTIVRLRRLAALLGVALLTAGAGPTDGPLPGTPPEERLGAQFAAAQSALALPVRLAVYQHFEDRVRSDACRDYFRLYAMNAKNWLERGDTVKVEVQFVLEFRGPKPLYGRSERARQCLGRDAGEGFFQINIGYLSAGYIYTLSKWTEGWHVDKVEPQP